MTNIQDGHALDAVYEQALAHFSEQELANLSLAIASINAWNRMAISFRAERPDKPAGEETERSAIADDGGKVSVED